VEAEGTLVTWSERIPDPDNPDQLRQIDVRLRRDEALTLVECRRHKEPQDVTWIEELMGRRTSLGADAIVAVSASGFTQTAKEKANRYGIILRDTATLSRKEVENWGRRWKLTVQYCEFSAVQCVVKMQGPQLAAEPTLTDQNGQPVSPLLWRMLIQDVMHKLQDDKWPGLPSRIQVAVSAPLLVNGKPPAAMELHASVRRVSQPVELASVVVYADPISAESHAAVAKYQLGETEIIENCDETAMIIDLSRVKVPEHCCFETMSVDAGRIVNTHICSLTGAWHLVNCQIPIDVVVAMTGS
jgi:Restriction endonuclease